MSVCVVWVGLMEFVLFAPKEPRQQLTVFAQTADQMNSFLTEDAFAEMDLLTTLPRFAQPATSYLTASSSMDFALFALEVR